MTRLATSRVLLAMALHVLVGCGQGEGTAYERGPDDERGVDVGLDFNVCPSFDYSMIYPRDIPLGASAAAVVDAEDPEGDRVRYRWRASSGSFTVRSRPQTVYTCDELGPQTLAVTATDGENCSSERRFEVLCLGE